jgi:hypothetical protein
MVAQLANATRARRTGDGSGRRTEEAPTLTDGRRRDGRRATGDTNNAIDGIAALDTQLEWEEWDAGSDQDTGVGLL